MPPEPLDGPGPGVSAEKETLRGAMIRLRGSIPEAERARLTTLIEENLLGLAEVRSAGTVLLFYSFGTEVATRGMTARLIEDGRRVLLPYLTDAGAMEAAELRPGDVLQPSGYGPAEPGSRIPVDPSSVDLVVAPGLAFDRKGHRLGYGGGHYDRFLARMGRRATRIGVAFSLQLVERVPAGPGDEPVDMVVTEEEAFDARPVQ